MNAPTLQKPTGTGTRELKLRQIRVGSLSLRVAIWPGAADRTPIMLFNGIGGNFELLTPFIDALGPTEVISFDMPGIGGSSAPPLPYRMATVTRLAVHVLRKLGHERADVIGVSWGGALAQQFAHSAPSRCRRLVLCATTAGMPLSWLTSPRVLLKLLTPARYLRRGYMERNAGRLYGGRFRWDETLVRDYVSRIRKPSRLGYLMQLGAITGWSSTLWLWRLRQPTLVLAGADDPIAPPLNAHLLAKLIPHARLEILDDGHLFVVAQPEITASLVREFLQADLVTPAQITSKPWAQVIGSLVRPIA